MHTPRNALAALLLLPCILAASPPVPLRWSADAARPSPYRAQAWRGETVGLECRLTAYGAPLDLTDADATICWQTNGMGALWWSAPAEVLSNVVAATWSPSMDCGADEYRFFLRVATPGGLSYRANGVVSMLGSPGETPSALPLPVPVLDFAAVAWTNAPWALPEDIPAPAPETDPVWLADRPGFVPASRSVAGHPLTNDVSLGMGDISGLTGALGLKATWADLNVHIQNQGIHVPRDEIALLADQAATAATNDLGSAAWEDASAFATADDLAGWLALTNAQFSVSNDVLTLAYHGTNVWSSSAASGDQASTNYVDEAIASVNRRWGDWTADGAPNQDADAVILNRATAIIASGFTLASSGAFSVLASAGAVAYVDSSGSSSRWMLDATNYVAIAQGGTVTVGASASGIEVTPSGGVTNTVYLTYPYSGGDHPIIWYASHLAGEWQQIPPASIVWVDAGGGTTGMFTTTTDGGFFKATTTVETGAVFTSPMPIRPDGGILVPGTLVPIVYDSVVEIQSGGHTYRIPAQLVE